MLPDLTGKGRVDRFSVLVSGAGVTKLLGVPKLPSGTGKPMTEAVLGCLEDKGITHRVQAMSFDTTSSNTGRMIEACKVKKKSKVKLDIAPVIPAPEGDGTRR